LTVVPGRTYSLDSILSLLKRSAMAIAVCAALGVIGTAVYVWRIPDRYRAEATLLVRPSVVPQNFVRSSVTLDIDARVRTLSSRVLSADSLSAMAVELGLVGSQPMPDVIRGIGSRFSIEITRADAFQISYVDRDPLTAARVTARLAQAFVEENVRSLAGLAEKTDQFLDDQLQSTRDRLGDYEKRLEEYRRAYAGQLPSQLPANLQVIQNAQTQLQNLLTAIHTDQDRKLQIEQAIAGLAIPEEEPPAEPAPVLDPLGDEVLALRGREAARQLPAMRTALQRLELSYKADHPDVVRLKRVIAELEARAALEPPAPAVADRGQAERRRAAEKLRSEVIALEARIAERQNDEKTLRSVIARYQGRVELIPTRETELTTLMRDYDTLRESYKTLLVKKEESQLASELERQRVGESLQVASAPRVPARPFEPLRARMIAFGGAGGLLLAVFIAAWREFRDSTLRSEAEILAALNLPVLAVVPVVDASLASRRGYLLRIALVAFVVLAGAAAMFYLRVGVGA
jgi:polysaccharide biosynthesis transport protein